MYIRETVLLKTKVAGIADRFIDKKMTKDDVAKLNELLDAHGIPKNKNHPGVSAELEIEAQEPKSRLIRALDHVKAHKGKYLLGGLGLGGALWAGKKYRQSQQEQAMLEQPPSGF